MNNTEFAQSLREIADLFEKHPEASLPHPTLNIFAFDREEFIRTVKALSDGGTVHKYADAEESAWPRYHGKRDFHGVVVDCEIDRKSVCRIIKPAQPAIYECPDSLLEQAAEFPEVSNG
jgi:hypothetical protein